MQLNEYLSIPLTQDPLDAVTDGDAPAPAGAAWLDDPEVEDPVHVKLWAQLPTTDRAM